MEAAVVSMALKVVGNKLAPLLIKEYTSIVGVKRDLEDLRDQVEEINSWLETRYEAVWNDPSFNWLKRLKDVAYAVDDVVDEFQLKVEKHAAAAAAGGGRIISKYVCTKPKSFILQCKVANKIKKIKRRFDEIVKQRTNYNAVTNCISVDPPVRQTNMKIGGTSSYPDDVSSVVGRNEDKKHIISKLLETDHQLKIKIISVIGIGGSGKTTLSKLVFNDGNIKKHFDFTLWVHVSQKFDVSNLVQKMFEAFADNNPGQHDMPSMRKTISDKLVERRFLLVLDDVWTESKFEWEAFKEFLINIGAPGSRILLTARSSKVAETVGSTYQFLLPLLSEPSSWQLFIESFRMATNDFDSEFHDVGKQIVGKCGGVPLAIKVLAGVLCGKEHIDQWKAIRDNNLLYVEGEEHRVAASLRLSYFHLLSNLKQCFTICSVFPKGHKIDKEQLIDLWIAHDMITLEDGVDSLEYVGHKHFKSLLQVSFLQNVEEEHGRVTCGMHDLVHDLALSILGDEISLDMPKEATCSTKSYRYFSLIKWPEPVPSKNIFRKVRAVYMPWYGDYACGMVLKHAKHLRSVIVGYLDAEEANTICQVKYLKHLAMSLQSCETLPKGISNVWSLQSLHVTQSYSLVEIPESICKLKALRTLNLSGCTTLKNLPDSIGDCQMISSIDLYNCRKLTMLPDSIGKLQKLRTLNLSYCTELKCLPDSIGNCQMISSIDLCGCSELTVLPESIGRNEKLIILRLSHTKVERLPSIITTLRNLECLDLLGCFYLVELPEGIGNMVKLRVLNLRYCNKLGGMPVDIGQLSQLQNLSLFVVGKGEKFAGISELANVSRIGEGLTIKGISYVLDPNDAHMACLKQKAHLQRLELEWLDRMADDMKDINTELEQAVLDGLEPPPEIEEVEIHLYPGRQCARWMQNQVGGGVHGPAPFPLLRVMRLRDLPNLKNLHGLVELPCLEELNLQDMPSLESISGGPFPSLMTLRMEHLPSLGEVWMVEERAMSIREVGIGRCNFTPQSRLVRVGNCLAELHIINCSKMEVKPHLPPTLQHLHLDRSEQLLRSPGQCLGSPSHPSFSHLKELKLRNLVTIGSGHGCELLQHMTALESLEIRHFDRVHTELPESLWSLTSLRSLKVQGWRSCRLLPESLGGFRSLEELSIEDCDSLSSLPRSMGQLTSLQELVIGACQALHQLPDCLGELYSLCKLELYYLPGLTFLPQSMCCLTTSLQELKINRCTGIKSLPDWIKDLTALKKLCIWDCPDLVSRCERGKGEDWHLISHIPSVFI